VKIIMEKEMIQNRLRELGDEIAETLRRLPAHSVKPPIMKDLLNLEDERDMLLKRLNECQRTNFKEC
jgi:hypothetical protein